MKISLGAAVIFLIILSSTGCSNGGTGQVVDPTQSEFARQTLIADMAKTPLASEALPSITLSTEVSSLEVGGIIGNLSYPSEYIPGMLVVAYKVNTSEYYAVTTLDGQGTYQMDNLPPGTYHVVAYFQNMSAGYSMAVPCGLSMGCTDHGLIDVVVTAGNGTGSINPNDWFAPTSAFPAKPDEFN